MMISGRRPVDSVSGHPATLKPSHSRRGHSIQPALNEFVRDTKAGKLGCPHLERRPYWHYRRRKLQLTKIIFFLCLIVIALLFTAKTTDTRASTVDTTHKNPLVRQAIEDLAQRESIPPADIEVVSVEEVVWPDTSMGCPHPDMRYRQVPQDGARIILRAGGSQRVYHSGGSRAPFLCGQNIAKPGIYQFDQAPKSDNIEN